MKDSSIRIAEDLLERVRRRLGEMAAAGQHADIKTFVSEAIETRLSTHKPKKR